MCLASHFDIIESSKLNVGIVTYYAKKILNTFTCVKVRIAVEKWNVYEDHIFQRPLLQTCRLGITSLCLNIRFLVKKIPNSHYFFEINVIVCLLCAHHLMTSISFILENLTVNKKSATHLVIMFQSIFFFAFLEAENLLHIVPFGPTRYELKGFKCLEVSNCVRNWNKVKKHIHEVENSIMPIGNYCVRVH